MTPEDVTTNPRLAGLVRRYHTWPVIREQTVAEHSWQVARIYLQIFGAEQVPWEYILWHDAGEIATGDVPYPVKAESSTLKSEYSVLERMALQRMGVTVSEVTPLQMLRAKFCDMVEMWEYGLEEVARGNKFGQPIVDRIMEWISSNVDQEYRHQTIAYLEEMAKRLA